MQIINSIDAKIAYQNIKKNKDIILLDVRTPQEYKNNKIEGSINIPVDNLREKVLESIPDKNKIIYVYCLSGARSAIALETLSEMGFENIFDVKNGLLAWRFNNLPLI